MNEHQSTDGDGLAARAERISRLVEDLAARCTAGETINVRAFVAQHADLLPELCEELRICGLLDAEGEATGVLSRAGVDSSAPTAETPARGSGTYTSAGLSDERDTAHAVDFPPNAFPGYSITHEISTGGQGIVLEAVQHETRRTVAIKLLREGRYATREGKLRFAREIELSARLTHPNIVTIFHAGETTDGQPFYVMEFVAGVRLDEYVRRRRLSAAQVLRLFVDICEGVEFAHRNGVVHRDLKPGNILIADRGLRIADSAASGAPESDIALVRDPLGEPGSRNSPAALKSEIRNPQSAIPKILDFGLAKWVAPPIQAEVTLSQNLVGTIPYMSPEQARGETQLDGRTDVYSLGVMLYVLLTGQFPYAVHGPLEEALRNIASTPPTPPSRVWSQKSGVPGVERGVRGTPRCPIDRDVETIVLKALDKDRERRYATAGALGEDLRRYLDGRAILARRGSALYVAGRVLRGEAARRPVLALALISIAAAVAAERLLYSGVDLFSLDRALNMSAFMRHRRYFSPPWSDQVVVVTFGDDDFDGLEALAEQEGISGVARDSFLSWRSLHGALLKRLAAGPPIVVAWDFFFERPAGQHDDAFAMGMRAVQSAGSKVVLAYRKADSSKAPALSPALVRAADGTGWGIIGENDGVIGRVLHLVDDPPAPPSPSLSLAAFCQSRPGWRTEFLFKLRGHIVFNILWFRESQRAGQTERDWGEPSNVLVTSTARPWISGLPEGASAEEREAVFAWGMLPARQVLDQHSVPYTRVMRMTPDGVRAAFGAKIVFVGDTRVKRIAKPDLHRAATVEGVRDVHAVYVHASGACDLINGVVGVRPYLWHERGLHLLAGASGVMAVLVTRRSLRWACANVILVCLLWAAANYAACAVFGRALNIVAVVAAVALAAVLAALVERWTASSRPSAA